MWNPAIFEISDDSAFESLALELFRHQYRQLPLYRQYCRLLNIDPSEVTHWRNIPFLPIEFFKRERILSDGREAELVFSSSGTTADVPSMHYVSDPELYHQSAERCFRENFGPVEDWTLLALLPSYLERKGSSLVYMIDRFIGKARKGSGFYLDEQEALIEKLHQQEQQGLPTLLWGVSFALLDLAERLPFHLNHTTVIETGGMKGRRKEMVRDELHAILKTGFGVNSICSEYGMTELLSQAYSHGDGLFRTPPWVKVLTRDTEDPLSLVSEGTGGINVIDLANVHSCAFIATQDLGRMHPNGQFEVLGRFDHSDVRGCNLMMIDA
jgi:phenylacetate-coenzyme A ligase PaaK-like adenylate-forming protein